MPGVPSGRGCDACRKQRKKCDQLKPACSRCSRLQLACVGAGTQRFKFKADTRSGITGSADTTRSSSRERTLSFEGFQQSRPTFQVACLYPPSNDTTLLVGALVAKLKASDDLRYHLTWSYGDFIEEVPRRLGTSAALDTAVLALLTAHSNLASCPEDRRLNSSKCLKDYSGALKALRLSLDDPSQARKTETLCAVMLLLICQGFIGVEKGCSSAHGEGAGHILKARGYCKPDDEFESKLLLSLRGPMLFEALINPKIRFSSKEWGAIVENGFAHQGYESIMMHSLAQLPEIMRRGRKALHDSLDSELGVLVAQMRYHYSIVKATLAELREILISLPTKREVGSPAFPIEMTITHAYFQRTFGLCLAICIAFNCVLKALDHNATDIDLELEAASFGEDVLELAREASKYRPIGASFVTLCLIAAWCGCRELPFLQLRIQDVLLDYMGDFGEPVTDRFDEELRYISDRLALVEL